MKQNCKKWAVLFLTGFIMFASLAVARSTMQTEASTLTSQQSSSRAIVSKWVMKNGKWYYYDEYGKLVTGWKRINNKWYFFDRSNVMVTGWQKISGKWYYMNSSGAMLTGWQKISGKWYYMSSDGVMVTGWMKSNNKWYYLCSNGAMAVGWQKVGAKWYYFDANGVMVTGWQKISGKWYYMSSSGSMVTGWVKSNNKWYYMSSGGAMSIGWQKDSGKWYYMNSDGVMMTGWLKLGSEWYYLENSGKMAVGWETIGSKSYLFDLNGVWLDPNAENQNYLIDPLVSTPKRVTVHDPSIVKDPETDTYYIFGSHMAWAKSKDLVNWTPFSMNINTNYRTIFQKPAQWAAKGSSTYDVSGNLWAPDVIYNEKMGKWCMYMSVNGDSWYSSIVLLTADSIEGPYTYVGPVVYSGFRNSTDAALTDYSKVMGNNTVPSRYTENRNGAMTYSLNAIDPCVLYDDDGNLWMSYGSWFGGLYMLKLDAATGLRDYSYTYKLETDKSDPYLGIKIAGGYHSSGEASYIEKIGDYYYLYVTLGGLDQKGGYNMRVFRSEAITGPYVDVSGDNASYTGYYNNVSGNRGVRLMSQYRWSYMNYGYVAQGHNSCFVDDDDRAYLVYHTRFDNQGEGHQVRVHQLFTNEDGWLVAAPFEYYGERLTLKGYTAEQVDGVYEVLFHTSKINYGNVECVTGKILSFNADGTVTGDVTGTWNWSQKLGSPYVDMKLGSVTYRGVFVEQKKEESTDVAMCFTVLGSDEMAVWGYGVQPNKAVEMAVEALKVPSATIDSLNLSTKGIVNTTIAWSSSHPSIISDKGDFTAPDTDTVVTLTAKVAYGDVSKTATFSVLAYADKNDKKDMVLHTYPQVVDLSAKTEKYPNWFNRSIVNGLDISGGVVVEFDVERKGDSSIFSNILSFNAGEKGGLYFTGGSYLGYNALGGFFDANIQNGSYSSWGAGTDFIGSTKKQIRIEILPDGFKVYADGTLAYSNLDVKGSVPGEIGQDFSYASVLNYLNNAATEFNLGWGSWWDDKFNGTISNIKLIAKGVEYVDTSAFAYYEDFSRQPDNYWTMPSEAFGTYMSDGNKYGMYTKFTKNSGTNGNRGAYAMFDTDTDINGSYTIEVDVSLTAGVLTQRSETGFAIMGKDASGYTGNSTLTGGYILKLVNRPPEGTAANQTNTSLQNVWKINDTDETVEIPVGEWVTIKVQVDTETGKALLTITNRATGAVICENKQITINGSGTLGGLQFVRGRGIGEGSVDTIKVTASK